MREPAPPVVLSRGEAWFGATFFVYMVKDGDKIVYVGQSNNIGARIKAHMKNWGRTILHVEWEEFATRSEAMRREAQLIRELDPPINMVGRPRVRSYG